MATAKRKIVGINSLDEAYLATFAEYLVQLMKKDLN
jgi:hypothetical protein